eukprot:CAMPEP_0206239590 /NCGR_PEP_ID=MMETSP0047_2-20121206/15471_1 /ASSEMBLY_ACC=CAM_ASM_000192 /TAXON_ID=195065 /ORGANISM="Chroomonas mesostigmatica_cf, Strain CCMP1168" /LENGTH=263 /DNA_ID=CAMNT_0053664285 /DNA_START=16 /DNA_END=807 /DNA_ORIENTATION=-
MWARNAVKNAARVLGTAGQARSLQVRSFRVPREAENSKYGRTREDYVRVLDTFAQHRACAVLRTNSEEACSKAMEAAIAGGFKIVEFTLTTPGCLNVLADFRKKYDGKILVGCGTVMDIEDGQNALDAGAEFLVAPVLIPEVVKYCASRNIVIAPGCATPSELYEAYLMGAPLQKLFPGVAGGHTFVKAVSAALPMLHINPTSGVDLDNAGDFLMNGAASVGLVAPLFDPADISSKNWDAITYKASKVIKNCEKAGPLKRKAY